MKLFPWISKKPKNEQPRVNIQDHEEVKVRDLVVYKNKGSGALRSSCRSYQHDEDEEKNESEFMFGQHRESSRSSFYRSMNLKHLGDIYRNNHSFWPPTTRQDHVAGLGLSRKEESAIVARRTAQSRRSNGADHRSEPSDNSLHKDEKKKVVSKMKELLKWAAASRSNIEGNKGWKGSNIQSKVAIRAPPDHLSTSSSGKTSSTWDIGSCSTSSSIFCSSTTSSGSRNNQMWSRNIVESVDNLRCGSDRKENPIGSPKTEECKKPGHWISTDSNFVVLELRK